jgi:phospholipase/carboxylesterase
MGDGAIRAAAIDPASGGRARGLVVLLHGYGADGSDLRPLAEAWRPRLPEAAFLLPDATESCDSYPVGRQWFPLALHDAAARAAGVAKALPGLNRFLDAELARRSLTNPDLVLMGFSQGAMMALAAGLERPGPIAGIIAFAGLLVAAPPPRQAFPPVLLGHGLEDPLIPAMASEAARNALVRAGAEVESLFEPGLGHGISRDEMSAAEAFLKRVFPGTPD